MVKRYPHTAIITIEGEPKLVNGKRVSTGSYDVEIQGRYETDGKTIKKNEQGKETVIQGSFYTKTILSTEGRLVRIRVEKLGIDKPILPIDPFQSHSVINV